MATDIPRLLTPLPQVMYVNLEPPLATVLHVMRMAKAAGVRVMFNASPLLKEDLPVEIFRLVTDIVMNEEETEKVSRVDERGASIRDDLLGIATSLLNRGVGTAVITLGADGYFYATDGGREYGSEKGLNVKAVDVTPAGDSFLAAFAIAIMRGARASGQLVAGAISALR